MIISLAERGARAHTSALNLLRLLTLWLGVRLHDEPPLSSTREAISFSKLVENRDFWGWPRPDHLDFLNYHFCISVTQICQISDVLGTPHLGSEPNLIS